MSTETTEKDRMHALALRTVEGIEAEAAAIRLLERAEGDTLADIRDEGGQDAVDAVIAARDTLELEALDAEHGEDETGDVADGLDERKDQLRFEGPLSIRRYGYNDGNGWETESVTIVLGTGGPHIEVQYRGDRATAVAYGWFGADRVELPVDADAVNVLFGVDDLYNDLMD